jgi:hypothetical protein
MNRQVFPSSLFPLRGDISAEAGATSVTVQGIQGIPVQDAYFPLANYDTMFYNSTENLFYFANPWEIPVGQVLEFEGYGYSPVGISWLASDTIAIGDGTQGDVSGAAAMTALILFGSSAYADYDLYHTTIYSGATVDWSLILPETAGSSGQVLTTNGQGFTYWMTPTVPSPVTPGGSTGDIQYNNAGAFGGSAATITAAGTVKVPVGQVLEFTGSGYTAAGLSWLAADTLAVGNGNEGDVSGGLGLTALILFGSSAYSDYDLFHTTIYSGAIINWSLILPETAGSAGQVLTVANGASGIAYTEWASVPLPNVTDSGVSGFWGGMGGPLPTSSFEAVGSTTGWVANQATVYLMYITAPITITKVTIDVTTLLAGGTASAGIFLPNGTKVIDSGVFSTNTTGNKTNNIGSVTLQQGWYYFCWTASSSSLGVAYFPNYQTAASCGILNANGNRLATATATTGGAQNATLGALTPQASGNVFSLPCVWFE